MAIGERIKKVRNARGMTQKELAEKCGMFDSALRRIENGKQNPKLETLEKIAAALEVKSFIFYDDYIGDYYFNMAVQNDENNPIGNLDKFCETLELLYIPLSWQKKETNLNPIRVDPETVMQKIDELNNQYNITPELDYNETNKIIQQKKDTILKLNKLNALGQQKANEYITDLSEQDKYTKPDEK